MSRSTGDLINNNISQYKTNDQLLFSPKKNPINLNNILSFPEKSIKTEPISRTRDKLPILADKNPIYAQNKNNNIFTILEKEQNKLHNEDKSEKSSIVNCLICCDKESNAVFLDCGHGGFPYNYIYIIYRYI